MRKRLVECVAVAAILSTPALGAGITVKDGWFRALPGKLPAGGYFTMHNGGAASVSLTGASSPACGMLMLHKSEEAAGMSRMEDVTKVDVPAGGDVKFAPGGYHLMCMDTTAAMKIGATVPVTFSFADGSKAMASFAVKNARGQ